MILDVAWSEFYLVLWPCVYFSSDDTWCCNDRDDTASVGIIVGGLISTM